MKKQKKIKELERDLYFLKKWRKEEIEYLNKQRYYIEEEERQYRKFGISLFVLLFFAMLIGILITTCD